VMGAAFNSGNSLSFPPKGVSLRWFHELFGDPEFRAAFVTSLRIAVIVAILALIIAAAFTLASTRRRGKLVSGATGIAMMPIALPGVFLGVALFSTFLLAGIRMSPTTAVAGQLVYIVPFAILVLSARLRDFDLRLEEAARTLGYSRVRTLLFVTLRIVLPSLAATFLLAWATSLDEFFITYWVIGQGATLPIYILSRFRTGIDPRMNAVATLLLIVPLTLIAAYSIRQILRKSKKPYR